MMQNNSSSAMRRRSSGAVRLGGVLCLLLLLMCGSAGGGLRSRKPIAEALAYAEAQKITPQWIASRTNRQIVQAMIQSHSTWSKADCELIQRAMIPLRRALLVDARERARQAKAKAIMQRISESYPEVKWKRVDGWIVISLDGTDPDTVELVGL